jgi:hypothetical protein
MTAVRDHGIPLVDDPDRLERVRALGVDETAFVAATATSGTAFATGIVALDGARGCSTWCPVAAQRFIRVGFWSRAGLVRQHHGDRGFTRRFSERLQQLGLPPIRLDDLRHGWATMALSAGVHPKIVQELLGHANIGITLDIYSHVTATLQEEPRRSSRTLGFAEPDSRASSAPVGSVTR